MKNLTKPISYVALYSGPSTYSVTSEITIDSSLIYQYNLYEVIVYKGSIASSTRYSFFMSKYDLEHVSYMYFGNGLYFRAISSENNKLEFESSSNFMIQAIFGFKY